MFWMSTTDAARLTELLEEIFVSLKDALAAVVAAVLTNAMRRLRATAVGTSGRRDRREEVVGAALTFAGFAVAALRIRHGGLARTQLLRGRFVKAFGCSESAMFVGSQDAYRVRSSAGMDLTRRTRSMLERPASAR